MAKNKQKTDTTKPATPDSPKPVKVTAPIPALSLVESETMELMTAAATTAPNQVNAICKPNVR